MYILIYDVKKYNTIIVVTISLYNASFYCHSFLFMYTALHLPFACTRKEVNILKYVICDT